MPNITWNNIPICYEYVAMDSGGSLFAYREKPDYSYEDMEWIPTENLKEGFLYLGSASNTTLMDKSYISLFSHDTLVKRPKMDKNIPDIKSLFQVGEYTFDTKEKAELYLEIRRKLHMPNNQLKELLAKNIQLMPIK